MSKDSLLDLIDDKIAEARARKASGEKPKPKPSTRAAVNRANARKSTGPKSKEGKATSAANSLKHGFFANVERLDPADAPTYLNLLTDFRHGMHPDGPIEDLCCRELAMLQARLQRLESIDYALTMGNIKTKPATPKTMYQKDEFNDDAILDYNLDSRDLAQAFIRAGDALDRVHKIEIHLRRAYNRTFDRLQRDRLRPPSSSPRPSYEWPSTGERHLPKRTGESVVRDQELDVPEQSQSHPSIQEQRVLVTQAQPAQPPSTHTDAAATPGRRQAADVPNRIGGKTNEPFAAQLIEQRTNVSPAYSSTAELPSI